MGSGIHQEYDEEKGTVHHTDYDNEGRHSFDYDPLTGDITGDHSVSNENQDEKYNWPDSNMWDDIAKDSESQDEGNDSNITDSDSTDSDDQNN